MELTWLGHSAVHMKTDGKDILIDPFFSGNDTFPEGYDERLEKVDIIALTHGHDDHIGDTVALAKKFNATVVAMFEVCMYLGGQGLEKFEPMNIGGTVEVEGIRFTMVNAQHSSAVIKDGVPVTMGDPAGLIIKSSGPTVYHAGDTEVFSDMALIQRLHQPKIGLIPMGDRFTMGPETAAIACNEFLELDTIIPVHWGTFPLLTGRPEDFAAKVKRGTVKQPKPGEALSF